LAEILLSSATGLPVIDYFIHELSQKLLIHELFVAITVKEKLILISHFICEIITIRLRSTGTVKGERGKFAKTVAKFIASLVITMIQIDSCIN
jgi:hypothetical protein